MSRPRKFDCSGNKRAKKRSHSFREQEQQQEGDVNETINRLNARIFELETVIIPAKDTLINELATTVARLNRMNADQNDESDYLNTYITQSQIKIAQYTYEPDEWESLVTSLSKYFAMCICQYS